MQAVPTTPHKWIESVCGNKTELLPEDAPTPKGKHAVTISYYDTNLHHNLITGRSVTGVLYFLNKTPVDWCSEKQATVETTAYDSECSSA